jgi:hypothetical protein
MADGRRITMNPRLVEPGVRRSSLHVDRPARPMKDEYDDNGAKGEQ